PFRNNTTRIRLDLLTRRQFFIIYIHPFILIPISFIILIINIHLFIFLLSLPLPLHSLNFSKPLCTFLDSTWVQTGFGEFVSEFLVNRRMEGLRTNQFLVAIIKPFGFEFFFFPFESFKFLGDIGIDEVCNVFAVHDFGYNVHFPLGIGEDVTVHVDVEYASTALLSLLVSQQLASLRIVLIILLPLLHCIRDNRFPNHVISRCGLSDMYPVSDRIDFTTLELVIDTMCEESIAGLVFKLHDAFFDTFRVNDFLNEYTVFWCQILETGDIDFINDKHDGFAVEERFDGEEELALNE
ncbi:hypothetical protein AN958_10326, partial [Leucoagaricus sp. SymC.cos]